MTTSDRAKDTKQSWGRINVIKDGKELFTTNDVYYYPHGKVKFITGNVGTKNNVALCVPAHLVDGPHTVKYPEDFDALPVYLTWAVEVDNNHRTIEKGTLTVTFGPNGDSADGSYKVTSKGTNEEFSGEFKLINTRKTAPLQD
ncbi:MAG: hypothetical protein ABWZ65_01615 [Pseudomonas mandelii]